MKVEVGSNVWDFSVPVYPNRRVVKRLPLKFSRKLRMGHFRRSNGNWPNWAFCVGTDLLK